MTYKVSVSKDHCWFTVAAFNVLSEAIAYATEKTFETGDYHLVEVLDGGKH